MDLTACLAPMLPNGPPVRLSSFSYQNQPLLAWGEIKELSFNVPISVKKENGEAHFLII
jgi:hypothetical protein